MMDVGEIPFGISFHPTECSLLAVGMVDGSVAVYDAVSKGDRGCIAGNQKNGSCRVVNWAGWNRKIVAGYESGDVRIWDSVELQEVWSNKLNGSACCCLGLQENVFAIGDDDGCLSLWDLRSPPRFGGSQKMHDDYISGLATSSGLLLATAADGRLSISEPRKNLKRIALSDPQDDELLSLQIIKHGKKVVAGAQTGAIIIWSWDTWSDSSDRAIGHPESIDAMLKIDEDTLCTGSSDGIIRLVKILPGLEFIANLGDHSGFPVERLALNADSSLIASLSHDTRIQFFNLDGTRQLLSPSEDKDYSGDKSDSDQEQHQLRNISKNADKEAAKQPPPLLAPTSTSDEFSEEEEEDDDDEDAMASSSSSAKKKKRPLPVSFKSSIRKGGTGLAPRLTKLKKKRGGGRDSTFFDGFL